MESVQRLLLEALEIDDPRKRAAFLLDNCGADRALRQEVEELIRVEAQAVRFLPDLPGHQGARAVMPGAFEPVGQNKAAPGERGEHFGHYKLLEQIGEGGFGIVYMAEQEEPVRRRVALKIIKLGMDTKEVIARFEAERHALALMDHPNIARVLDAGATDTGRPYFVMDLVRGIKITEYCDQNALSTVERLRLFTAVCEAVQHAHQKGVIHRDIKPSNILVTVNAAVPVAKVIDFGIAKATQGRLTDQTVFTALEQFIGTPAYMSPEQAVMTSLDIDTRSDIYSLGVLLYELLTGQTPFDKRELLAVGLEEMKRLIRDQVPMRPSTKLGSLGIEQQTNMAKRRQTDVPRLIRLMRGDLDWIVMKCLEKDRTRRYETANGLARDIQRYLNTEPVVARPPSKLYEFQKTVCRHRLGFAAATAILLALTAGAIVSTLEALRARAAERKETGLQHQAEQQAQRALLAEADAKEKLRGSYLAQAQAGRWSHRSGSRFHGLELLSRAAETRPSLELRNEAIACMTIPDLRVVREFDSGRGQSEGVINFDGTCERYAVGDEQGNIKVNAVNDNRLLAILPGKGKGVRDIFFSPDGQFLAASYLIPGKMPLYIWDLKKKEMDVQAPVEDFNALAFSPDSKLAAIDGMRGPLIIYDLRAREVLRTFPTTLRHWTLAFHPDGRLLAVSSPEASVVQVLDVKTGETVQSLQHQQPVYGLAWGPDGNLLGAGCQDGSISLWVAALGKKYGTLMGHQAPVTGLSFDHAGDLLVSGGWDGQLILWHAFTGKEICSRSDLTYGAQFEPKDNWLLCQGADGRLAILEFAPGHECRLLPFEEIPDSANWSCCFSPDGEVLASTHREGMRFWDVSTGTRIGLARIGETVSAKFDPSGTNLIINGRSGLRKWPVKWSLESSGDKVILGVPEDLGPRGDSSAIAWDNEGGILVTIRDGGVSVFDLNAHTEKNRFTGDMPFEFAAISSDAKWCAAGNWKAEAVSLFDVEQGNLITRLPGTAITDVVFSPNNRWLASAGYDEYCFWSTVSWEISARVRRENIGRIRGAVAFAPDSRMAAVAYSTKLVYLVDPTTGSQLAKLEASQPANIASLAFSPDGTKLAVCGWDSIIRLWDLRLIRQQLAAMKLDWESPP